MPFLPENSRPSNRRENFETCLADLLAFINRILWNVDICAVCATEEWIGAVMHILRMDQTGKPLIQALRPRLLAIAILKKITPYVTEEAVVDSSGLYNLKRFLS